MKSTQFQLNLVSLADILTNSVGMLILFAVICMLQSHSRTFTEHVPLMRDTTRHPVYFLCKADTIAYLDPQTVAVRTFERRDTASKERMVPLGYLGLSVRWQEADDAQHDLAVWPHDTSSWDGIDSLARKDSPVRKALEGLDPDKHYAFFYVADEPLSSGRGSGFAAFNAAKAIAQARGLAHGWMPFDAANPPLLCVSAACQHGRRPMSR